jgi:succinate dehydrogenase / fumarate reductase cytochrome b subunit
MLVTKGRPNRLGVAGWLGGGRWGFERYLYTLHRVTGLGLLAYFLMHIGVTTFRAFGPESWEFAMGTVSGPVFKVGEYLVFLAFAFHAVNGVQLGLIELGFGIGKPIEPFIRTCRDAAPVRWRDDPRRDHRRAGGAARRAVR